MRVATAVTLTDEQHRQLTRLAASRTAQMRLTERASIVLRAAEGQQDKQIAEALGCERRTAARWRRRFLAEGVEGFKRDRPRSGRPTTARAKAEEIVRLTTRAV